MTLATADEFGRPWASPVYFAHDAYRELFWISHPGARHSRNLAERAQLTIVVFDSQLPINTGQAVYMAGRARQVTGDEAKAGIALFSARSEEHGGTAFTKDDVAQPDGLRLYQASVVQHWILNPDPLTGKTADKRTAVAL
jgi:pyridoxine/pyridoxamine 5'-phosphate oxidase